VEKRVVAIRLAVTLIADDWQPIGELVASLFLVPAAWTHIESITSVVHGVGLIPPSSFPGPVTREGPRFDFRMAVNR
jgi:hypothetical protein